MIGELWQSFNVWLHSLQKLTATAWHNLTPAQYGALLIGVAFFGWLLMKSTGRKG